MTQPTARGSGWTAPSLAAALGLPSVPVLFVSSTSFVLALCLALASWLLAAAVFAGHGTDGGRRAVAALGALGGVATVGLATVPFFFQH